MTTPSAPASDPSMPVLGSLFDREPPQYGTRGDSYLWAELQRRLHDEPLPARGDDVERRVRELFHELTGAPIARGAELVYVAEFDGGSGAHAGYVSPDWWATRLIPILRDRHDSIIRGR